MNLDQITEILGYVLVFVAGMWTGKALTSAFYTMVTMELLKDLGIKTEDLEQLNKKLKARIHEDEPEPGRTQVEVKIEEHSGQLYVFRKDNNKFLGQGSDREQLIKRLQTEFKEGITLVVDAEDGADLIRKTNS